MNIPQYTIEIACRDCQDFHRPTCDLCILADNYMPNYEMLGETKEEVTNEHLVDEILKRHPGDHPYYKTPEIEHSRTVLLPK